MVIYKEFDKESCLAIARAAGNTQIVKDVAYACFLSFHNKESIYCERIDDKAFLVGQTQKKCFRIIGMGTKNEYKRQGLATCLLNRLIHYCRVHNISRIHTRSKSGADYYAKRGFDVVGMRDGDYLLEFIIN